MTAVPATVLGFVSGSVYVWFKDLSESSTVLDVYSSDDLQNTRISTKTFFIVKKKNIFDSSKEKNCLKPQITVQ